MNTDFREHLESLIQSGDLVRVKDDSCEKDGYPLGTEFLVAGIRALPVDKDDPYVQKIFMITNVLLDGKFETDLILMDPMCLERVSEERAEEIKAIIEKQFANDDASVN